MSLITALSGTITWDGTATVAMSDTSGVAVNDYIRMNDSSLSFKITAVSANVNVTIDLAGETAPSGSGAEKDDGPVRDAILAAGDVNTVPATEAITESVGAGQSLTRKTSEASSSASVYSGKTYTLTYNYMNGPDSKAWGALSGVDETVA